MRYNLPWRAAEGNAPEGPVFWDSFAAAGTFGWRHPVGYHPRDRAEVASLGSCFAVVLVPMLLHNPPVCNSLTLRHDNEWRGRRRRAVADEALATTASRAIESTGGAVCSRNCAVSEGTSLRSDGSVHV